MMLGLALGEAAVRPVPPGPTTLPCGVGSQLACFTVLGLIRASIRHAHRGISSGPGMAWEAYRAWAALQGLDDAGTGGAAWLAEVPALRERRGSAPATVAALQGGRAGTLDAPVTSSAGGHALVRTLPVGAMGLLGIFTGTRRVELHRLATAYGALTHGHPTGYGAAADGAVLAAELLDEGVSAVRVRPAGPRSRPEPDLRAALGRALDVLDSAGVPDERRDAYAEASRLASEGAADPSVMARVAGDPTGTSCLAGAVYAACANPFPDRVTDAITLAGHAADPYVTAATTGAMLGALHGVDVLPVALVSRLELAWVVETLAGDLVRERTESPSGGEYHPATDPYWWPRYMSG